MNEILLNNEVIVYLLSETVLYFLLFVAFVLTIGVLRRWNFDVFTTEQFALENRSYLVITIIFFAMLLKILLLPYFVYTVDSLSDLVPGAMCGAGVIKANSYGNPLLSIKIVVLFLSGLWLSLNALDLQAKNYPCVTVKSWFFVVIFLFLSAEYLLDLLYFTHIETTKPVSCCSVIFGQIGGGADSLPFGLDIPKLLILFYLLVWGSLLLGVFYALDSAVMKLFFGHISQRLKRVSLLFLTFFVLLCSAYVAIYYLKNGVLL